MSATQFSQIIGNEEIKIQLTRIIERRAIGHAFLFSGPEGIGKSLFATAFAAQMMHAYEPGKPHLEKISKSQHPDIHVYRPEGKLGLHSIQSLRQLSEEVHLPPYEASWKVFIVHDADRMLSTSANALLKTFEEPPPGTLIILLSHSAGLLLPTLLSRCSAFHFKALKEQEIVDYLSTNLNLDFEKTKKIASHAKGSINHAIRLATQGDDLRIALLDLFAKGKFYDFRALQKGIQSLTEKIESTKKQAEEASRDELKKMTQDSLSAVQQHAFEKEIEGLTALAFVQEARSLFETIADWYRDLQFLLLGGSPDRLTHPEFETELVQAVQRGEVKPLDQVYQAIENAYLSLQRSTSLPLVLENLFLTLDRIG